MRFIAFLAAFLACACGRLQFDAIDAAADANGGDGAPDDAPDAAPLGPFAAPTMIAALTDPGQDDDPTATGDLLELYFASERLGAAGGYADIFVSKRMSVLDPWPAPTAVTELNTMYEDQAPGVSSDGLTIYFSSRRPAGARSNVWMATRGSRTDVWSAPVMVAELAGTVDEFEPQPDESHLHLVLYRVLPNNEIFESSRASTVAVWGTPVPVDSVNMSTTAEQSPCLAASGRELWFGSDRGASTMFDLYVARRASVADLFGAATAESALNGPAIDNDPWVSPDGHTLLMTSNRTGDYEIYEAHR